MADQEEDQGITAYHGSPHEFEQFDLSKIGTGEGNQSYGHGLYFAEHEPVATGYRDALTHPDQVPLHFEGKPLDTPWNEEIRERWPHHFEGKPEEHQDAMEALLGNLSQVREMDQIKNVLASLGPKEKNLFQRVVSKEITKPDLGKGSMYEVSINAHPDHFLDWERPFSDQSEHIQKLLEPFAMESAESMNQARKETLDRHESGHRSIFKMTPERLSKLNEVADHNNFTGEGIYNLLQKKFGAMRPGEKAEDVSKYLSSLGVRGIKYLDADSRRKGVGTRNYVVFDDKLVNVKRRYARGGKIEDRPHFGFGGEGEGPVAGSTGSAAGNSYGGGSSSGGSNPGDMAGGGYGSGNIGGGSSTGGGGGSSFGGGGGGGRDSSPSINRSTSGGGGGGGGDPSLRIGGPQGLTGAAAFGRPEQGTGTYNLDSQIPMTVGARLSPNIGADLVKEAVTPDFSTGNSPLVSGVSSYDQNAINALYDRMREEQQAARDASVARAAIGPVTRQINVPNAGDLYGATDAPLAVNQKPSGMFGQPEFGTTQFGQGPMQSGFPTQSSVPPMTGEEARQGDVPGMSQEALDWNRKMDAMQQQNQSLFSPETNQAVNSATNKFLSAMREMPAKLQEAQPLYAASQIPLVGGMIAKSYGLEQLTPTESAALYNRIYSDKPTLGQNLDWSFGQRAGSMGSMPSGTQQYASDLTPMSSQPARPITPTPSTAMMPTSRQTEAASPAVKQTIRDNFNSAFAAARERGDQTFPWTNPATGQTSIYTTQLQRKNGGRIPSFAEPDEWLAEKNESKKPERSAIAKRSGVLSSSKS